MITIRTYIEQFFDKSFSLTCLGLEMLTHLKTRLLYDVTFWTEHWVLHFEIPFYLISNTVVIGRTVGLSIRKQTIFRADEFQVSRKISYQPFRWWLIQRVGLVHGQEGQVDGAGEGGDHHAENGCRELGHSEYLQYLRM